MFEKSWYIPLKTVSESNCSEHWTKKAKRHRTQQKFIKLLINNDISKATLPCHIKVTRISTRSLDYDNLVSSQKWVVDAVCDSLIPGLKPGRADGDKRITVSYDQRKGAILGVEIGITSLSVGNSE